MSQRYTCSKYYNAHSFANARLGRTVGKHPGWTIGLSLAFAALCLAGMIRFRQESRSDKLWVPSGADSIDHKVWVEENFPETTRALLVIVEAKANGNVLDPTILRQVGALFSYI